jgi:outer membrane protein OmpA-like peptidoglycan-associated protein
MKHISLIILLLALVQYHSVDAQDKPVWYWGTYAGVNINTHNANFRELQGYPNCCLQFENGTGLGYAMGGLLQIPLNNSLYAGLRLGIHNPSGTLFSNENIGFQFIRNPNAPFDTIGAPITVEHSIVANLLQIHIQPSLLYQISNSLFLSASLGAYYAVNADFDQKETLISPSNATFLDGKRIRNEANGTIPEYSQILLSGDIGISYDIPVSKHMFISPYLSYHLPFTSLNTLEWKVSTLQLGLSFKHGVLPTKEKLYIKDTIYQRDTITNQISGISNIQHRIDHKSTEIKEKVLDDSIVQTTYISESYIKEIPIIKAKKTLSLSLQTSGIDKKGNRTKDPTIQIEEIETTETFPLLPYVFFNEGEFELSSTAQHLINRNESKMFSENKVFSSTLDFYKDMLNIIGFRMQSEKGSILIIGNNNASGKDALEGISEKRANEVANYLHNTWSIPNSRLNKVSGNLPKKPSSNTNPLGQAENSRVEIESNSLSLIKPIIKQTVEMSANPPSLEINPIETSSESLASWDISIEQNGTVFQKYKGTGKITNQPYIWDIPVNKTIITEEPIKVKLHAIDTNGNEQTIEKDITLQQLTIKKKREEFKDDKKIDRFSLLLFDHNSAELDKNNVDIINNIKSFIKPLSKVIITGYADITGEKLYNQELARKRCLEVQKKLEIPDSRTEIIPMGSNILLYNNDSPQGRSYSRTVQIQIETPIH